MRWFLAASAAVLGAIAYRDLAYWEPGGTAFGSPATWLFEPAGPGVIYAIVAALIYQRWSRIRVSLNGSPAPLQAGLLLVPGALLFAWARWLGAPDLLMASLVPVLLGGALAVGGTGLARVLALPLLVTLFAVPLPAALTNHLVYPLQLAVARVATALLDVVGITALQQGDVIHLAGRDLQIIETCSGIRTIANLLLLAVVYVGLFPLSRLHAALLLAAAPLIASALNIVRVIALVLIPGSDGESLHMLHGALIFAAGFGALYALDHLLLRILPKADQPRPSTRSAAPQLPRAAYGVVAVLTALATISLVFPQGWNSDTPPVWSMPLPDEIDGHRGRPIPIDTQFLGSVRFTWQAHQRYGSVDLFVGSGFPGQRSRSVLSPKNLLPGRGWEILERSTLVFEPSGLPVEVVIAESTPNRILSYTGYRGVRGVAAESVLALLALNRFPWSVSLEAPRVARLSTPISPEAGGREMAEQRLNVAFEGLSPPFLE